MIIGNGDSHQPHPKQKKLLVFVAVALLIAVIAGTGGYVLGMKTQPIASSLPSSSAYPIFVPLSNPSATRYPTPTSFTPPPNWKVYKNVGYQYSYPPTWRQHPESPESNTYTSAVSAPTADYPNGYFTVGRGQGRRCESRWTKTSEGKQEDITIRGYPAVQTEGKSIFNGVSYNWKSVKVTREDTCYHLEIISINNPEQWMLLNQILSTFEFNGH